jgi:hypothetical protein
MTSGELVAIPLSLLLGNNIGDGQEPSVNRLAKRHGLDRLDPATLQQVSNEMVNALLQQQAATPIAFGHSYLTPFSTLGLTGMSPYPGWKIEGILNGVNRPTFSHRLIWVELPLPPRHCLGILDLLPCR